MVGECACDATIITAPGLGEVRGRDAQDVYKCIDGSDMVCLKQRVVQLYPERSGVGDVCELSACRNDIPGGAIGANNREKSNELMIVRRVLYVR